MKKLFYFIILLFSFIVFAIFFGNHIKKVGFALLKQNAPPTLLKRAPEKDIWLNIFVHGTFGTVMGMLSLPKIVKDDVKGSWYHEIIKDMRKDPKFFSEQTILKKGLVKIDPTFDITMLSNKKLAAYPITKSFKEILTNTYPNQINFFYTYGWTGLMSQKRRRLESIRLYNELCEEIEKYREQNLHPKIRIITHSHGGNLCLNLAAINNIIKKTNSHDIQKWSDDLSENASLTELYYLIKNISNKDDAKLKGKMKQFDYMPLNKGVNVQELILMGVPIQPETELFCKYDFFEKIYNIYSIKDYVQQIDFISTRQGYSSQRISHKTSENQNKIIQVRVMVERRMKQEKTKSVNVQTVNNKQQNVASEGLLNKVISSAQAYFANDVKDPTHKDLWFATWGRENELFLAPLPIVTFIPWIIKAITQVNKPITDFDVNLKKSKDDKYLKIQVSQYNQFTVINEELFPFEIVKKLQFEFKKWEPKDNEDEKDKNLALIFNSIKVKFNSL